MLLITVSADFELDLRFGSFADDASTQLGVGTDRCFVEFKNNISR